MHSSDNTIIEQTVFSFHLIYWMSHEAFGMIRLQTILFIDIQLPNAFMPVENSDKHPIPFYIGRSIDYMNSISGSACYLINPTPAILCY